MLSRIYKTFLSLLFVSQTLFGADFEVEYDLYYSNAGLYFSMDDQELPVVEGKKEFEIYRDLLLSPKIPKFFLIEASINPLPLAGVYIKDQYSKEYNEANVKPTNTSEINMVKAVTAGFEEPYALSFFFGNVIKFKKPNEEVQTKNKGYMGLLLSVGDYHIHNNTLISDNWKELELKVKGDQEYSDRVLSWSFRVGARIHENPDISDTFHLGIRRSRLDFLPQRNNWLHNSGIDYRIDFDQNTLEFMRNYLTFEKNFPQTDNKAFILKFGFVHESKNRYIGSLAETKKTEQLQFLLQPNYKF